MTMRAAQWFTAIWLVVMFTVFAVDHCVEGKSWFYVAGSESADVEDVEDVSDEQMREWMRRIREAVESERDA